VARKQRAPLVLAASSYIGGIARTHLWEGNRIDIGGHRCFTKSTAVEELWAAQRIHGLSFVSAVLNSLRDTGKVKSLIKSPRSTSNTKAQPPAWAPIKSFPRCHFRR
jgi:hypothetical protein